jgi:hypothetical protein
MTVNSPEKLREQVVRQLGFLQRSCMLFDAGYHDEAIRIATVVRILLHDTTKSTSLLMRCHAKTIHLLSTCEPMEQVQSCLFFEGLDHYHTGSFSPKLGAATFKEDIPAELWWTQVVVLLEYNRHISRRDLVLAAANRDGGAHVDDLTAEYQRLTDGSWVLASPCLSAGHDLDLLNADIFRETHFMALRQIGFEVLSSPALTALAESYPQPATKNELPT